MAAIHSEVPHARPFADRPSVLVQAAASIAAVTCIATGIAIARAYPIAPAAAVGLFIVWTIFAFARFQIALPAMLALMPITGFAASTGWMTFEELDLLILASSAGGYAALAWRSARAAPSPHDAATRRHRPMLSIFSIALVALFLASLTISLERGVVAAGGWRFDWFQGYDDPLNSLRIYKSFVWALLITPLVLDEVRKPGGFDRIGIGMTAALGLGTLAVLQERLAFTGLLDFSDDYRVTAPFWEMHVGGAALDGFLALTVPFAVRDALRGAGPDLAGRARVIAAWFVLALASYASLVTFSRGVYAAIPLSMLLLVVLVFRQRLRLDRREVWPLLFKGAVLASLVAVCGFVVFRTGGYRAVLAAFAVLALAVPVESTIRHASIGTWLSAVIAAALLALIGTLLAGVLPKGPYLVFALALVATVAAVVLAERRRAHGAPGATRPVAVLEIATWLWLALCACLVARHWGGGRAFRDCAAVLAALIALSFAASRLKRPVWPEGRREQIATIGFAALVMGSVAVFSAGAYMGGRFSTSRGDLQVRLAHWAEGIGRLHGLDDWLFGKGLGRFPATSLFESTDGTMPGTYRVAHRDGETFLAMTTPLLRYLAFDEYFRISQRVTVRPETTYTVDVRVRAPTGTGLQVELCEKQLLYHGACALANRWVAEGSKTWQQMTFTLQTGAIGRAHWYAPRPVMLAIAGTDINKAFEIGRVQVVGPDGVDVVANGDFSNGTARWFSSSDKSHLPWHIKNIALDVLFDQGMVGLALFALMVGGAFLRTAVGRAFRHPDAPYLASAIVGYLIVGAFDSLLDVPRVAFAFYLVTLLGLMLRNPHVADPSRLAPASPTNSSPQIVVDDEAAARAKRRQRAFGERVPMSR